MNIMYQSSCTFAKVMSVSIYSLLSNNLNADNIHIYVIDCGIYQEDKKYIEEVVTSFGRNITFVSMDNVKDFLETNKIPQWGGSYATYYKLFFSLDPQMKDLDKILYIDSDTIVCDELDDLYNTKLDDSAVGMVCSAMTKRIKQFYNTEHWYNAGVILFNLEHWRKHNLVEKIKDFIINYGEYGSVIGDESVINILLKDSIKKLPLKCNYESSWYLWGWNQSLFEKLGFEETADYTADELKGAKAKPIIAHYMDLTTGRPWDKFNDNPWRKEYKHYCNNLQANKISPEPPMGKGKIPVRIITRFIPFGIRSLIGFGQHDNFWKAKIQYLNTQKMPER